MCGVGSIILPLIMTEVGVMGPQAEHSNVSGYLSADFVLPLDSKSTSEWWGHPLVLAGYTRMFETGHALDYGIGYEHNVSEDRTMQFELRDYYTFANPNQHNIYLRAAWVLGMQD